MHSRGDKWQPASTDLDTYAKPAHLPPHGSPRPHAAKQAQGGSGNGRALSQERLGLHPSAMARRTELRLPCALTLDTWQHIGQQIFLITDSTAWWLGDWLIFGEDKFPDRYQEAVSRTALNYQTLRNYAWIARKFEPSRRRDKLSFQHHVEVAGLCPEDQDSFLAQAERLRWSRNELRRHVRQHLQQKASPEEKTVVSVQLALNPDRVACWQEAANQAGCPLPDWIASAADQAAESIRNCQC